jgi:ubiquinone/menaquinone biosynthesis C-methylase UbiE
MVKIKIKDTTSRTYWNKFAREYDSQIRYNYLFYRWIVKKIIKRIDKKNGRILDIGQGVGELVIRIANKFPKSKVIGVDASKNMIKLAKDKAKKTGTKNVKFIVSSIEKQRIDHVDFVVSVLVFHHLKNKELLISRIYKWLSKNGKLIIGDWFVPTKKYNNKIKIIRNKNPKRAKEFEDSYKELSEIKSKGYREKHPKNYSVSPEELKCMFKEVGFKNIRVIKSPLPYIAIVTGEK